MVDQSLQSGIAFDDDDCVLVTKGMASGKAVAFKEDDWILVQ